MQTYSKLILSSSLLVFSLMVFSPAYAATTPGQQLNVPQGSASLNWSGYVAQSSSASAQNNYTSITGTWIVPEVTVATASSALNADATWVGIGGVSSHDLIQAGTQATVQNGAVSYSAWVETLPGYSQTVSLSVQSGDSITSTLTEQTPGVWLVTIHNNTSGASYSKTVSYDSSKSSAEWVEEMVSNPNSTFIPLDSFGSVSFFNANATVNGTNQNLAQLGAKPLQMVNGSGQELAAASALNGDNAGFSVARTSVSPSITVPRSVTGGRWHVIQTATSTQGMPAPVTIVVRHPHRGSGYTSNGGATYSLVGFPVGFSFSIIRL